LTPLPAGPGVFDVDLAGSNLVVECRSRTGTGQQARQLDSIPLRPNATRPPQTLRRPTFMPEDPLLKPISGAEH